MKITVVIPYYREIGKLRRAVESVPQRGDVEVLVVDNGEEAIGQESVREGVRVIRSGRGAGVARNRGIEEARGEWIVFLDADDWLEKGAVERLMEMTEMTDGDAEVCYFMSRAVNEKTGMPSMRNEMYNGYLRQYTESGDDRLLRYKCGVPVCKLIRRSLLMEKGIRFDETPCCEDKMFGVKLGYHAGKIAAYEERLYVVTESGESLSCQFPREYLRVTMQAYINYNLFLREKKIGVKKDSVLSLILRAKRDYGIREMMGLWEMSVSQGNSVIGNCGGWWRTLRNMRSRRVIINADDMGLSREVNRAIEESFSRMEISSTSLMTNTPASEEAVEIIKSRGLEERVGLHFNLTEGVALSEELRRCPRFAGRDGVLRYNHNMWIRLTAEERRAVRRECEAQIEWMKERGLEPRHFDSHFHVHTSPEIYMSIRPVLKRHRIPRVRIGRNMQIKGVMNRVYKRMLRWVMKRDGFDVTRWFSDTRYIDGVTGNIEYECHPK